MNAHFMRIAVTMRALRYKINFARKLPIASVKLHTHTHTSQITYTNELFEIIIWEIRQSLISIEDLAKKSFYNIFITFVFGGSGACAYASISFKYHKIFVRVLYTHCMWKSIFTAQFCVHAQMMHASAD